MVKELKRNLETVKEFFEDRERDDSYLWETRDPDLIRYACYNLGKYRGFPILLYDQDGEGIRDREHLDSVLNKWEDLHDDENPYEDKEVFVVPADVHF